MWSATLGGSSIQLPLGSMKNSFPTNVRWLVHIKLGTCSSAPQIIFKKHHGRLLHSMPASLVLRTASSKNSYHDLLLIKWCGTNQQQHKNGIMLTSPWQKRWLRILIIEITVNDIAEASLPYLAKEWKSTKTMLCETGYDTWCRWFEMPGTSFAITPARETFKFILNYSIIKKCRAKRNIT